MVYFGNTLLICWLYVTTALLGSAQNQDEKFAFNATEWVHHPGIPPSKYVSVDDSVVFSCLTTDSSAYVNLLYAENVRNKFNNATSKFGARLTKTGQDFAVNKINILDIGIYQCYAKNTKGEEIQLKLGTLYIDNTPKVYVPSLNPQGPTYKIETNGDQNITCLAHGAIGDKESYLTWYREESNGKRTEVDKSRVVRFDKIVDAQHNDIEVLVFKNFNRTYSGKYVCVRKVGANKATEKSIIIELEPNASPKLSFEGQDSDFASVAIGTTVTVICRIQGSPTPKKYWERNGEVFFTCPDTTESKCSIGLSKVQFPRDEGIYSCVGENIVKKVVKNFTLEVQVKPKLKKPADIIVAKNNEDREIYCELESGNPLSLFVWEEQADTCDPTESQEKCKPIESDWELVKEKFPGKTVPSNNSFIVAKATTVNYFYRCSVSNIAGNDSHTIQLYRDERAIPQFSFTTLQPNLNEKSVLQLVCVADINIYNNIDILKNGVKVSDADLLPNNTKEALGLVYTISSATLTNSGEYICKATLKRTGERKKSLKITVKALIPPSINDFNDVVITQDITKNFLLNCSAIGNPQPSISWKHNNKEFDTFDIETVDSCEVVKPGIYNLSGRLDVLVFCSVNYKLHGGEFECIATNAVGEEKKSMKMTVNAKPHILNWRNSTTFGIKSSGQLTCMSEANPPANVSWKHLSGNSTEVISRMEKITWRIESVSKEDGGKYQCIAWNKHGKVEKTVDVMVVSGLVVSHKILTKSKGAVKGTVIGFVAALLVVLIIVFIYRRHLKRKYALYLEPNPNFELDKDRSLFEQCSDLPYDMAWEFPRERVSFVKLLGAGAFGQVWLAEADGITGFKPRDTSSDAKKRRKTIQKARRYHTFKSKPVDNKAALKDQVAIKTLKEDAGDTDYKDLASELKILIHLGEHENIVNLLGACTFGGKLLVILECCPHGNLLNFLREKREVFRPYWLKIDNDVDKEFTYIDLMLIAHQITEGMNFLQSKKCVHRDLAARNILVGHDYVMKVADFGLARDIYKDEFYLKESTGLLPVKWMAPESLFDKVYTPSSDVWSFGILLWEIFTLGGSPYPGLPPEDLFAYLQEGKRMERPDTCPKNVYEIMLNCWEHSPYNRPIFSQIGDQLAAIARNNTPDDSQYLDLLPECNHNYENSDLKRRENQRSQNSVRINSFDQPGNHPPVFQSPKGKTYVPPPINTRNGTPQKEIETPLLSPQTEVEYIPMTPADHYKSPTVFSYGQEAIV